MKKKFSVILSVILVFALFLAGCGSFPNSKVKEVPDASFAVVGNGGISVQQGRYIYFVNGYNEIADAEGKTNHWGKVVKGGIYRIDMLGGREVTATTDTNAVATDSSKMLDPYLGYYGGAYKTVIAADIPGVKENKPDDYSGFDMITKNDWEDNEYAAIEATPIVPKKVSNGKSELGGIYIFEDWIYYATPMEKRNKEGEVQYNCVVFMRTRLDGTGTEVLYETSDPEAALKYGYYRYDGKTYFTVLDGTTLKSVTCKDRGGKSTVYTLAEDVKDVLFSQKPVYYTGMRENGVEDFIYYTKDAGTDDTVPYGSVFYRVRPNGEHHLILSNDGHNISLKNVTNGYVYYSRVNTSNMVELIANDFAAYPADPDQPETVIRANDVFEFSALGSYSTLYVGSTVNAYDAETQRVSVSHYGLIGRNGRTELIGGKETEPIVINQGEAMTVIGVSGDVVYYFDDNRTDPDNHPELEVAVEKLILSEALPIVISLGKAVIGNFMYPDVTAGYLFYAATEVTVPTAVDKNTNEARKVSGYMRLRRVDGYGDDPTSINEQVTEPEWTIEAFDPADEEEVKKEEAEDTEEKTT